MFSLVISFATLANYVIGCSGGMHRNVFYCFERSTEKKMNVSLKMWLSVSILKATWYIYITFCVGEERQVVRLSFQAQWQVLTSCCRHCRHFARVLRESTSSKNYHQENACLINYQFFVFLTVLQRSGQRVVHLARCCKFRVLIRTET